MMPSATVDLPQPDSPTMPIASPGMTVQEKSMTAGISPLAGEEGDRQVLDLEDRLVRDFADGPRSWPSGLPVDQSFIDCSRSASASRLRPSTNDISAIAGGSAGWMKERSSRLASLIAVPQSGLSGARPRPK